MRPQVEERLLRLLEACSFSSYSSALSCDCAAVCEEASEGEFEVAKELADGFGPDEDVGIDARLVGDFEERVLNLVGGIGLVEVAGDGGDDFHGEGGEGLAFSQLARLPHDGHLDVAERLGGVLGGGESERHSHLRRGGGE